MPREKIALKANKCEPRGIKRIAKLCHELPLACVIEAMREGRTKESILMSAHERGLSPNHQFLLKSTLRASDSLRGLTIEGRSLSETRPQTVGRTTD
jgi:hypothetical protein